MPANEIRRRARLIDIKTKFPELFNSLSVRKYRKSNKKNKPKILNNKNIYI